MNFLEAVKSRRSYYGFSSEQPVSNEEINKVVEEAILHVPSAFNSQSTRIVVLYGEHHKRLWDLVLEKIKAVTPDQDAFAQSEQKVKGAFQSGYVTLLFFEEQEIVEGLKKQFPLYAHNFSVWSTQSNAMHQFVIWTALEEKGLGGSLQHYNELIEEDVKREWNLPESWKLIAQMPFGKPATSPGKKEYKPVSERIMVFK